MQASHTEPYVGATRAPISANTTHSAYHLLHKGLVVLPVLAGLDKFTMLLTDWSKYLSPAFQALIPFDAQVFMYVVGIVEIVAGLLVAVKPRIGGYVVGGWLLAIVVNLALHRAGYLDVALRDIGLAIAAFTLARVSPHAARRKAIVD